MMKKFSLKKEYEACFKYILESKRFIYAVFILFFIFALIGFIFPAPLLVSQKISEYLNFLLDKTKDFGLKQMFFFIFFNNLKSSFFGIIFGIFAGIFPVAGSLINGYVLGFVSKLTVAENGFFVLWRLIPHGIFELIAVFISFGMGLKLGIEVFTKKETFIKNLKFSLKIFFLIVLPLLLIAAIIESLIIFAV